MKSIEIYGQSDDNIYVRPSGERGDQFGGGERPRYLHFIDGTVLKVQYGKNDQAVWLVERVQAGAAEYERIECNDAEADRYSDTVWLSGESLCSPGTNTAAPIECWSTPDQPDSEEIGTAIEGADIDFRELPNDVLLAFYRACRAARAI